MAAGRAQLPATIRRHRLGAAQLSGSRGTSPTRSSSAPGGGTAWAPEPESTGRPPVAAAAASSSAAISASAHAKKSGA
eukprot:4476314-Lingulodinium_polyedra.AAC.1